jgi:plasmid stabilization system protein ParE
MTHEFIFRREATWDLSDIEDYYNKIRPSLADQFFEEFFRTMDFIEDEPELYQVRYRGIRIAPMQRFPYGIHYRETENQLIIYRVLHTKRFFR